MKDFVFFTNGLIPGAWILFSFCWSVSADVINDECSRPKIESPRPSLVMYQQTAAPNITVYHCLYQETNTCNSHTCSNCLVRNSSITFMRNSTYEYSDVTNNCLEAFITGNFTNKYNQTHSTYYPLTSLNICGDLTTLNTTIYIKLSKYVGEVNITRDTIHLSSGTVCKYSWGFCYDDKENIDVMWKAINESSFNSNSLRKINISDAYYFSLSSEKYAIIETHYGYYPLELRSKKKINGSVIWQSEKEGLIVSEGHIEAANNDILEPYIFNSSQTKQNLFGSLIKKCIANIKIREQNKTLIEAVRQLKYQMNIYFYSIVIGVLCLLCAVIPLIYRSFKKPATFIKHGATEPTVQKVRASVGNTYEYITSEYDINTIYNGKS